MSAVMLIAKNTMRGKMSISARIKNCMTQSIRSISSWVCVKNAKHAESEGNRAENEAR